MTNWFGVLYAQFHGFFKNLSPTKKMSIVISMFIFFVSIVFIFIMMTGKNYVPLFTKIDTLQLPVVVAKLREMNVPFQVRDDGATIAIPPELLHSTQMAIMTEAGDAKVGSTGLELFEKIDLGMTSYAQRINYQRALQGELMRSINSLSVVKKSKVILAIPPKKSFLEEGGTPKASVVIDLYPGTTLTEKQIKGIMNLVSSAVEGMNPENVTVVNSSGNVLSKNITSTASAMTSDILEIKEKTERQLEERIEAILSKAVGTGKVIARVDADLSMEEINSVEETVDPEKVAVRSVQRQDDKMNGSRTNPAGVPGARANLPGAQDAGEVGFNQNTTKEFSVTNYEVPKTVRKFRTAPGEIQRITIAVLVDGVTQYEKNESGEKTEKWTPRSQEELSKYESLVKNAIGFSDKRGDTIKIENIRFEKEDYTEAEDIMNTLETRKLISYVIRWSIIAVSLAVFFFLVLKPFMAWITESFQESVDEMLPKTIEELEELQNVDATLPGMSAALPILEEAVDPDKAESELLKERIMGIMDRDELKSANALNMWLVRRDM